MLGGADVFEVSHAQDAGTVEQYVETLALGKGLAGLLAGVSIGDVQPLIPTATQRFCQPGEGGFIDVGEAHLPAFVMKQRGSGQPDAAGGAGNQNAFHGLPPFSC